MRLYRIRSYSINAMFNSVDKHVIYTTHLCASVMLKFL